MRSGSMRHRLSIYQNDHNVANARDEFGHVITSNAKTLVARPWARMKPLMEQETSGKQTRSNYTVKFSIRYSTKLSNLDTTMFIEYKNDVYDITGVVNEMELNKELTVTAVRR